LIKKVKSSLRVALLAGTLGQGGAEKQLVYISRALRDKGALVRIYCLTRGEYYEPILTKYGLSPIWIGKYSQPILRSGSLALALRDFRPHVLQSIHFYTNLYTSMVAPLYGAVGLGSIRGDTRNEMDSNRFWGPMLMRLPRFLISNSYAAKQTAISLGVGEEKIFVLPNALDLSAFDRDFSSIEALTAPIRKGGDRVNVIAVGSLFTVKRFDRFLLALRKAREILPGLSGYIVGDGPEKDRLEAMAGQLGLLPEGVHFIGRQDHVPGLLSQADLFVLCSDHEGMPNVILEAMAARLPVITTRAGDAGLVVEDGLTGCVIDFDDNEKFAESLIYLANSDGLRRQFGQAGRKRVEDNYSYDLLGDHLYNIYRNISELSPKPGLIEGLRDS
jgi:glycosyltransferase involved in cell wall biosynthesis